MWFSFLIFLIVSIYCIYTDLTKREVNYRLLIVLTGINLIWDILTGFEIGKWILILSLGVVGYILTVYLYKKYGRIILGYGDFIYLAFVLSLFDFYTDTFILSWVFISLPICIGIFRKIIKVKVYPLIPFLTTCIVIGFYVYITFLIW
jgi:Flp pilus assembly protein protease CpaA